MELTSRSQTKGEIKTGESAKKLVNNVLALPVFALLVISDVLRLTINGAECLLFESWQRNGLSNNNESKTPKIRDPNLPQYYHSPHGDIRPRSNK